MHVVDGGWVVYMGGYSIAPESLRARKSCVFVKQQKLRKRKGAWKERETEVEILKSTFRSLWGPKRDVSQDKSQSITVYTNDPR